jgi:hypothetical protein
MNGRSCGTIAAPEQANSRSWATYVLSFADFKLSRNCRPLAVVVSAVSVLAFDSACARAIQRQQSSSTMTIVVVVSVAACFVGDGRDVAAPWRGWREREGLLVEPSRRVPSSCHPASRDTPHVSLNHHRRGTQQLWELHVPAFSGASQGDRPHRP